MVPMGVLAAAISQVLGSPLHPTHASISGGAWTPALWFLASEQGIWLDPDVPHAIYARKNLLLWSEDFSRANWTVYLSTKVGAIVIDGVPCMEVSFPASIFASLEQEVAGLTNALGFTGTFRVRAKDTPTKCQIFFGNTDTGGLIDVPTTWTTISRSSEGTANVDTFSLRNGEGVAKTIYVAFAQLERSPVTTDYQKVTDWSTEYIAGAAAAGKKITCYQNSAGTIPVTAVEQPVGLMLDKRLGLVPNVVQAPLDAMNFDPAGSTPPTAANTTFLSEACGSVTFPANAGGYTVSRVASATNHPIVAGRRYTHSYRIALSRALTGGETLVVYTTGSTGSNNNLVLNSGTAGGVWIDFADATVVASASQSGSNSCYVYAGSAIASPITVYVRQYTAKEIPGNHASQPTAASRPVLSARKNLLLKSEDFSAADWARLGSPLPVVTANAGIDPLGGNTADRMTTVGGQGTSAPVQQVYPTTEGSGRTYTASVWVKSNTGSPQTFRIKATHASVMDHFSADMTATTTWHRFEYTVTNDADAGSGQFHGIVEGTGFAALDILVWGAQLEYGPTATTYQRVTTATDYDSVGFPHYLKFDGVDDFLSTGNIDFTATHEMTVVAGVQSPKTSQGMLLELGTSYDSTFPSFVTFVPNTADGKIFAAYHDSAGYGSYSTAAGVAINANVIAYSFDTAATTVSGKYPRFHLNGVNGMTPNGASEAAGAAFINAPLYIGRRGGTSTPFLGKLYQLVVRGAMTADLAPIETFTAEKTGVTLP